LLPLGLCALAFRHVAPDALDRVGTPIAVGNARAHFERQAASIFGVDVNFVNGGRRVVELLAHHRPREFDVLGHDDLRDVQAAQDLLARVAGDLFAGAVDGEIVALEVVRIDDVVRIVEQRAIAFFGEARLSIVAQNLGEAAHVALLVAQQHHQAVAPEARAVLAQMPTLVFGFPLVERGLPLRFGRARRMIFRREDDRSVAPDELTFTVAEQTFDTRIPTDDSPFKIGHEDGEVLHALHEQLEQVLALGRSLFRHLTSSDQSARMKRLQPLDQRVGFNF
jgi:hypothetical protein